MRFAASLMINVFLVPHPFCLGPVSSKHMRTHGRYTRALRFGSLVLQQGTFPFGFKRTQKNVQSTNPSRQSLEADLVYLFLVSGQVAYGQDGVCATLDELFRQPNLDVFSGLLKGYILPI